MKLAVVGHSLVADRQIHFFDYLDRELAKSQGGVMQIAPSSWGRLKRKDGFKVDWEGSIYKFAFEKPALKALSKFKPDILYAQEEFGSAALSQAALEWKDALGCKLAAFVWENQRLHGPRPAGIDLVIAGNREASFLHKADAVQPQVGIDPEIFFLNDGLPRNYDAFFAGKQTREKGFDMFAKLPIPAERKLVSSGNVEWLSMGSLYRKSKVVVTPSRDTALWKEQFAPFANVEGLMSGCSVVASASNAMVEWIGDVPGVRFFEMGDYDSFEHELNEELRSWTVNREGRQLAVDRFGRETVGENLVREFQKL